MFRRSRWRGSAFSSACCGVVPVADLNLAAHWYRHAIAYLPAYVKARVHLAEIYASQGQTRDAEALPVPALSSRDPEVRWRLADVLIGQGRFEDGESSLTPHGLASRSSLEDTYLPSQTMPQSSTPAAATTSGGLLSWRERMSRIVRPGLRSNRCRRSH
jgi:hypothetical protein